MAGPHTGAPEWESQQSSPWIPVSTAIRIFDAFSVATIVQEMNVNDPPGACANGARYLIGDAPTGAWIGHAGELAIAKGTNASNGWDHATVALQGMTLFNGDDDGEYRYISGAWDLIASGGSIVVRLQDLTDVSMAGVADGYVLTWDLSNGNAYFAPVSQLVGAVDRLSELTDVDVTGQADGYVLTWDESNQLYYLAPGISLDTLKALAAFKTIAPGATINWNLDTEGPNAKVTIGAAANAIQTPTNPSDGVTYSLMIIQDGSGNRTVTWPASISFGDAGAPTLSTGAGKKDLVYLQCLDASAPEFRATFNKAA